MPERFIGQKRPLISATLLGGLFFRPIFSKIHTNITRTLTYASIVIYNAKSSTKVMKLLTYSTGNCSLPSNVIPKVDSRNKRIGEIGGH